MTNEILEKSLAKMASELETKQRLTEAETLLKSCAKVLPGLRQTVAAQWKEIDEHKDRYEAMKDLMKSWQSAYHDEADKLSRIPRWIRKIFNAD